MAKRNRFRKFEIITGFVAIAFLIAIPLAAALCIKKFIFDSTLYESWQLYVTVLTIIGVSIFVILSILSNVYIIVKMFGGTLSSSTNSFFLTLIMIFSGIAPGVMVFVAKHHTTSSSSSYGSGMINREYDDEDPEEKRKRKQAAKEKEEAERKRTLRRSGTLSDLLEAE